MNAFKQLRFKDKLSDTPELTQQQVADMTGLTKGAISRIEKSGNVNMDSLQRYHKAFNVSYEYLLGETETKDIKYHALDELFPFNDTFYKNLEQLLELDKGNHFVEYMLSALLYNPDELFMALVTISNTLYQVNHIQQDKELSASAKTEMMKMHEYIFSQSIIEFLENTIMPLLDHLFKAKEIELAEQAQATEDMLKDIAEKNTESSVIVKIEIANPIENNDSNSN